MGVCWHRGPLFDVPFHNSPQLVTANNYGNVGVDRQGSSIADAESTGPPRSIIMRLHICCAMALWILGTLNTLVPVFRRRQELRFIHKGIGYAFLSLWMLVVGPTSAYLSLCIRADPIFGHFASVVLLDVTFLTYYFFWRAWRVARERRQGQCSLALHGNLMALGLMGSMSQLPQRGIQLAMILVRALVLACLRWMGLPHAAEQVAQVLSHQLLLGQSMLAGNIYIIVLIDGPRGPILKRPEQSSEEFRVSVCGETDADEAEMYPHICDQTESAGSGGHAYA